jgi:hypothetical protein
MVTSTIVTSTQIYNVKMTFSKNVTKRKVLKVKTIGKIWF